MDSRIMEVRIRRWVTVFEEQAKSGLNKGEWCFANGINRTTFFRWQRRVRSYLLEHGERTDQEQVPAVDRHLDPGCFVELPCSQGSCSGLSSPGKFRDDIPELTSSIRIHCGEFSIHVNGEVDERQLAAVLRAMKNAD